MVPFEWYGMVSYSHSIVTTALSCIISEIKRNLCSVLPYGRFQSSLTPIFSYPLHSTPLLGQSSSDYCHTVWYGKIKIMRLADGE